jgi:hypothetical protein
VGHGAPPLCELGVGFRVVGRIGPEQRLVHCGTLVRAVGEPAEAGLRRVLLDHLDR